MGRFCDNSDADFPASLAALKTCFACFFSRYFRHYPAVADGHRHAIDGRMGRAGKDIGGVERLIALVAVHLRQLHTGDKTVEPDSSAGLLQWQAVDTRITPFHEEVRRQGCGRFALCGCGAGDMPIAEQYRRDERGNNNNAFVKVSGHAVLRRNLVTDPLCNIHLQSVRSRDGDFMELAWRSARISHGAAGR